MPLNELSYLKLNNEKETKAGYVYCIVCGTKNPEYGTFCYKCGAKLVRPSEQPTSNSPEQAGLSIKATELADDQPAAAGPVSPNVEANVTTTNNGSGQPPVVSPTNWPNQPPPPYYQGYGPPPYNQSPGYQPYQNQPPNPPYGYNPIPAPPSRPAIAPNGLPYVVVDNPNRFLEYKTKEGKRIYASYSELWPRVGAAVLDTIFITAPFYLLALIYFLTLTQAQATALTTALFYSNTGLSDQYQHWVPILTSLVYLAYCTLFTATNGQTLGKRITRIKIITLSGSTPDLRTSLLRNLFGFCLPLGSYLEYYSSPIAGLVGQALAILVVFGFTAAFFNPRKQGWHDRLAGTVVVKAKELVEGIDFPAKG